MAARDLCAPRASAAAKMLLALCIAASLLAVRTAAAAAAEAHFLRGASLGVSAPLCSVGSLPPRGKGSVLRIRDGFAERCAVVITPRHVRKPLPVLVWFHETGSNAKNCASHTFANLAVKHHFAFVCAEALQNRFGPGGRWVVPSVKQHQKRTSCELKESVDVKYMRFLVGRLWQNAHTFDPHRLFFAGCSLGAAFAEYWSVCHKRHDPQSVSAFATHSTGMRRKGDMLTNVYTQLLSMTNHPNISNFFPRLDEDAYYWPVKPETFNDSLGLKACVFDSVEDPIVEQPYFFYSSRLLANKWKKVGNKVEEHYGAGGHCHVNSYEEILECLDDGTGRLLHGHRQRV
eukprot:TRINITY_DN29408_c0_g4_i1.p1 TRINITY_DN29408_c0_g4~~TRINITY_DN29408_c0_g4_i1.p1  ORF type:complete len:367 (-),score=51.77 TRINITY_DN29408_c0_g4_i1:416-1450(-)